MQKTILILTDNLLDQINGVVTTYKNIETFALLDGYRFVYITPREFRHINCPIYHEVKIAYPREIGKKIEEIRPNHIHIATEGPIGLWGRAYLTEHGYSYNTAYHTKFPEGLKTLLGIPERLTWRYIKWFHKHTGRVLTTTESMAIELKTRGLDANIIPWTRGVDRSIFNPSQRNKVSSDIVLLSVGRISKEKNLDEFCKLEYPNSRKIMVGGGPYLNELREKYPNIEYTGYKTGLDLAYFYANADVFVMPSVWETFGIVMIEAMACGTPVAAFPTQGPIDVIDAGKTGFMSINLQIAIEKCLHLNREEVVLNSKKWSWQEAWNIFKQNLIKL